LLLACQARQNELGSPSLSVTAIQAEVDRRFELVRGTLKRGQLAEATEALQGLATWQAACFSEVTAMVAARKACIASLAEVGTIARTDVLYGLFSQAKDTIDRAATAAEGADVKGATDLWNEAVRLLTEELKPAQRFEKLLVGPAGLADPELRLAAESIASRYARAQAFLDLLRLSGKAEAAIATMAAADPDASMFTALLTQELERALQPAAAGRIQESSEAVGRTQEKVAQLRTLAPLRKESRALLSELEGLYQGIRLPESLATLFERAAQAENAVQSLDFARATQAWQELHGTVKQEPTLAFARAMKQGNAEDAERMAAAGLAKVYPPAAEFLKAVQLRTLAPLRTECRALLTEIEGLYQGHPLPTSFSSLSERAAQAESAATSLDFARATQTWRELRDALKQEPVLLYDRAMKQGNAEDAERMAAAGLAKVYPPAAEFLSVTQQLVACRALFARAEAAAPAAARNVLIEMRRDVDRVAASACSTPLAQSAASLKQLISAAESLVLLVGLYPTDVARLGKTDDMDDAGLKALPAVTAVMAELDGALRKGQFEVAIEKAAPAQHVVRQFISTPSHWRRWTVEDLGMEFRRVQLGSFSRLVGGAPCKVILTRSFWMGRCEVTRAQFRAVMGYLPARALPGEDNCPVDGVDPASADEFCARLTQREAERGRLPAGCVYRLPTEAQWEYCALAGRRVDETAAGWVKIEAWCETTGTAQLHPVGLRPPNPWGLCDLYGNVWELCADWIAARPVSTTTDPHGPAQGQDRVVCGGSVMCDETTCLFRSLVPVGKSMAYVGFRVVLVSDVAP
jgi:hypothetical protein